MSINLTLHVQSYLSLTSKCWTQTIKIENSLPCSTKATVFHKTKRYQLMKPSFKCLLSFGGSGATGGRGSRYHGRQTGSLLSDPVLTPTGLTVRGTLAKEVMPWTGEAAVGAELPCTGLAVIAMGTPVFAYRGMTGAVADAKAGLGIKKANCPSFAGTNWKPPKTLGESASVGLSVQPMDPPVRGSVEGSCTWRGCPRCAAWLGSCWPG